MARPKLSLLFPHLSLGGGETAMMDLGEALAAHADLDVAAVCVGEPAQRDELGDELQQRLGAFSRLDQRWKVRSWLAEREVVLWYGTSPLVPGALRRLAARPTSVRVVHTERIEDGPAFHRRHARVIDATVCVSPTISRTIPGATFIANACSETFLRGPRQQLFVPGRKTLGFLGRLVPLKNARWLVEQLPDLACNLAMQVLDTEVETAEDLRRLARQCGVETRIRFLPPSRDVGTLLRSIDGLVVVSAHEGFPRVVVEAGLLGVPVISTRVGALPEVLSEEILFVESLRGTPIRESLQQALDQLEPSLGHRLQARVRPLCDPGVVARRYLRVIESAVRDPAACSAAPLRSGYGRRVRHSSTKTSTETTPAAA